MPTNEQIDGAVHALAALLFPDMPSLSATDGYVSAGGFSDKVTVQVIRNQTQPTEPGGAQQEQHHGISPSRDHSN